MTSPDGETGLAPASHSREISREVSRGDGLLHPIVLVAVVVLVVNDHWWKGVGPALVTGKLSDLAGLLFFPLLLQALVEVVTWRPGRPFSPSRRVLLAAVVATGVVFAAVKLVPFAGDVYRHGLGVLSWPLQDGFPRIGPHPVALVADPTDLLTLPVLGVAWWLGHCRADTGHENV